MTSNFYWLSSKEDVLDFENSKWYVTANSDYADLTGINDMSGTNLLVQTNIESISDTIWVDVRLDNQLEHICLFVELALKNADTDQTILPVFWEDNYISLIPEEKRQLKAYVLNTNGDIDVNKLQMDVTFWNSSE